MLTKKPRTVSDLMTREIVTVSETDTLEQIEKGMERFRFRHVPVVRDGKLIGLVSHRDLLHAASSFLSDREAARNELIHRVPAERIMHTELLTVSPDEPLIDAAKLMWESKLGCLPVVEEDNTLVGIVTEADFIRCTIFLLSNTDVAAGRTPLA